MTRCMRGCSAGWAETPNSCCARPLFDTSSVKNFREQIMRRILISLGASALTTLAACATPPATTAATAVAQPALVPPLQQAENAITTDLLLAHIKVLASDELAGRPEEHTSELQS